MSELDEIEAMKKMGELLEQLDEGARTRALGWVQSKYGGGGRNTNVAADRTGPAENVPSESGAFSTFADLFDAAQPMGDRDKALVAAYWAQVCLNAESFASQSLNDELKDLGHRVSNITDALTRLKSDRPALILQLKKSGTSKQARKTYKLTQEGVRRVQAMINSNSNSSNSM